MDFCEGYLVFFTTKDTKGNFTKGTKGTNFSPQKTQKGISQKAQKFVNHKNFCAFCEKPFVPFVVKNSLRESKHFNRILFHYQRFYLVFKTSRFEIFQPTLRRDEWKIGTEKHSAFQLRIGVLNQLRREIFW